MRINEETDSTKFTREIEIPDADDHEIAQPESGHREVRGEGEAPFTKAYAPESLPKLEIPDLPLDALSVSVDDLAEIDDTYAEDPLSIPVLEWSATEAEIEQEIQAAIQENKTQADQRAEILQARMGMLTSQISSLNEKLDRLENSSKIKV
jgi:hypothetical protein